MKPSEWESLASRIGPLRYQMSKADCAPTTVINALLLIYQRRLPPALVRNVWSLGADFDRGTGFVGTHMLASLLDVWFQKAFADKRESREYATSSYICVKETFRVITETLVNQGVCCISISEGSHYVLLLAFENDHYLVFDPGWNAKYQSAQHQENFGKYFGLVNRSLTKRELIDELSHEFNREVHVISHATA